MKQTCVKRFFEPRKALHLNGQGLEIVSGIVDRTETRIGNGQQSFESNEEEFYYYSGENQLFGEGRENVDQMTL